MRGVEGQVTTGSSAPEADARSVELTGPKRTSKLAASGIEAYRLENDPFQSLPVKSTEDVTR